MKSILQIVLGIIVGSAATALVIYFYFIPLSQIPVHLAPFQTNIDKVAADNTYFRHVIFTGARSQLVVMSIPPGGEVGDEVHPYVEQMLYFRSGTGIAILNGKTTPIVPGDVVVVTPGTEHNFKNTGTVPMQIITTYAPPNHIDGRIQKTIADEESDTADNAFGDAAR